jgi:hypothetical protein
LIIRQLLIRNDVAILHPNPIIDFATSPTMPMTSRVHVLWRHLAQRCTVQYKLYILDEQFLRRRRIGDACPELNFSQVLQGVDRPKDKSARENCRIAAFTFLSPKVSIGEWKYPGKVLPEVLWRQLLEKPCTA